MKHKWGAFPGSWSSSSYGHRNYNRQSRTKKWRRKPYRTQAQPGPLQYSILLSLRRLHQFSSEASVMALNLDEAITALFSADGRGNLSEAALWWLVGFPSVALHASCRARGLEHHFFKRSGSGIAWASWMGRCKSLKPFKAYQRLGPPPIEPR